MIAVKLEGRLGNQLFQYAFIYAAAKKLNTNFYLDKSIDHFLLDQHFMIKKDKWWFFDHHLFSINGFKNIFSHYSRYFFYNTVKKIFFLRSETFSSIESPLTQRQRIKNRTIYTGYFQSELYFFDYRTDIRKVLSIKEIYRKRFEGVFSSMPRAKKYVALHIRRGDYIAHNLALDMSYYYEAIKAVHEEGNFYIFISDDPDFVKNEFHLIVNKYVSSHEEIIDLQFLMNADVCILSASSFSWWGAWLNINSEKIVIAPKTWLGRDPGLTYPNGVLQPDWKLI